MTSDSDGPIGPSPRGVRQSTAHARGRLWNQVRQTRGQLAVILCATIVALGVLGGVVLQDRLEEGRATADAAALVEIGPELFAYSEALHDELVAAVEGDAADFAASVEATDRALSTALARFEQGGVADGTPLSDTLRSTIARNATERSDLRELVLSGDADPAAVIRGYTRLSSAVSSMPLSASTSVADDELARSLVGLTEYSIFVDRLRAEVVALRLASGGEGTVSTTDVAIAMVTADNAERTARAATGSVAVVPSIPDRPVETASARRELIRSDGESLGDRAAWLAEREASFLGSTTAPREVVVDVSELAAEKVAAQQGRLRALAIVLGVVALAGVVVVIVVFRMLLRPLERLSRSTRDLTTRLPELLAAPDQVATGSLVARGGRTSMEVEDLAEGVQMLTSAAIEMASLHERGRRAQGRQLETVARRQATLVNRQLGLLEQYEARELDPVALAHLFELDHVAALMRRSTESILVLAGASQLRPAREPVALHDVLRSAASEISEYRRVDVEIGPNVLVVPHAVARLIHLFAELMDNATKFSPPASTVRAGSRFGDGGLQVYMRDFGLGMDEATLDKLRRRVAAVDSSADDVLDQLGILVVGSLARHLGAAVTFLPEPDGTTVVVTLPLGLFVTADDGGIRPVTERFPAWKPVPTSDPDRIERRPGVLRLHDGTPAR